MHYKSSATWYNLIQVVSILAKVDVQVLLFHTDLLSVLLIAMKEEWNGEEGNTSKIY